MQSLKLGDLVQSKSDGRIGFIIESRPPNDGLFSIHIEHIKGCYSPVYYVCFPNDPHSGPFNVADLSLQQCLVNKS